MNDPDVIHTYPVGDLIEHELEGDGCPCGVTVEPVKRDDGTFGWLYIHHSLDGRERWEHGSLGVWRWCRTFVQLLRRRGWTHNGS
jgi:hypothetical protein